MKTLFAGDKRVKKILGTQRQKKTSYRLLRYCISVPVADGRLVYNDLTKELLLLSPDEVDAFASSPQAIARWFSVPENFDEKRLTTQIRQKLYRHDSNPDNLSSLMYLLFTTTACNARCPYCFELGHQSNTHMTLSVADRTAGFIVRRKKKAILSWYGGEPLLNPAVIDRICTRLWEQGMPYSSIMASNCYLLTDELVQKAVSLWKLSLVQVAIDGTEERYNATKRYACVKDSPYQRVLQNIKRLLDAKIKVCVHLNLSADNGDDLMKLTEELYRRFGENDDLIIQITPLFERTPDSECRRNTAQETAIAAKTMELTALCTQYGFMKPILPRRLKTYHCNPDRNREVTILPDGKVGWCDGYLDSGFIGDVDHARFRKRVIRSFQARMDELPECAECALYPDCIRLKKCSGDVPWCTEQRRELKLQQIKAAMLWEYQQAASAPDAATIIAQTAASSTPTHKNSI